MNSAPIAAPTGTAERRAHSNESPCIGVCLINPRTGYCAGCFRTLPEISGWRRMTAEERSTIIEEARKRSFADEAGDRISA